MRYMRVSISEGPSPLRARSTALLTAPNTANTSVPSTISPGKQYKYSVQAYNGALTADSNTDFGQTLVASDIASETTTLSNKLTALDAGGDDHFGWSAGVDQFMIVGAPEEDKSSDDWDAGAHIGVAW